MNVMIFEDFPELNALEEKYISVNNTDFIKLQPIMDLCRENGFTLLIDFPKKNKEG